MVASVSSRHRLSALMVMSLAAALHGCGNDSSKKGAGDGGGGSGDAPTLPTAQGTCPAMIDGDQQFLGKNVLLHVPPADAPTGGPLIIYWHGTGSSTAECQIALSGQMAEINAQGGVVACMDGGQSVNDGDYTGPFEWYSGDYNVADEVVACATAKFKTDAKRIHTLGMSAGGLQASQMAFRRAYVASAVSMSGGCIDCPEPPDPTNKIPMMFFHGSEAADVVVIHFYDTSHQMENTFLERGQFALDCDHNGGHMLPPEGASMWKFFQDHPYRVTPEPYAAGIPAGFPSYCQIVTQAWPLPGG
jgi:predicted esterase